MPNTLASLPDIPSPATPSPDETAAIMTAIGFGPQDQPRILADAFFAAAVSEAMARSVEESNKRILAVLP